VVACEATGDESFDPPLHVKIHAGVDVMNAM
jgi:hypothetical protein